MQSDIPPLPISCLTDNRRLRRNSNLKTRLTAQDSKNNSIQKSNRSTLLSSNRKQLRPLIAGSSPYKNSARFNPPDTAKFSSKSVVNQRVSSAKMLRIKQLQNQLADAHFHLNELSNENKLLKAVQKRQEAALKRYEGTNAELPRIINTHHEDLRVLQTKYKKLRSQYKETSDVLKEKENELHSLQVHSSNYLKKRTSQAHFLSNYFDPLDTQVQNKKLLQLSKDRHLGEREKLQTQVFDLNHRVNQQDEIIQTLKRKLALETKYLKHQLHAEMVKHKETQKQLQDTQLKLRSTQELLEQMEKRSYQASQLAFLTKDRSSVSSQSLTNLSETRSENIHKGVRLRRRLSEAATGQSLPALNRPISITRSQSHETPRNATREALPLSVTETHLNLEQMRNIKLQKSPASHRAGPFSTSRGSVRDSPIKESQLEDSDVKENHADTKANEGKVKRTYELPKTLKKEFGYSSDDDKNKMDQLESGDKASDSLDLIARSRLLHARLVSSATEGVRTSKTQIGSRSRSLTKENMDNIMENDKETKYDRDSVITVIDRGVLNYDVDTNTNYSNLDESDLESEIELPIELRTEEDEHVIRKSDIIIDDCEMEKQSNTSSHLSKLFTKLHKPSDFALDSKENKDQTEVIVSSNNDKSEFKSVNGLLVHVGPITENFNRPIDKILAQKSVPKDTLAKTPWDDDRYTKSLSQETKQNSVLDRLVSPSREDASAIEDDVKDTEKQLLSNINQDLTETKSESNVNNYKSNNNVTNYDNVKESNLKSNVEQKTVNENSTAYDKVKLLAAMKAIDDNENIEFVDKSRRNSASNRLQITENLYRGVPTHSRRKSDIMKELFSDTKLDNNKNSKEN